MGFFERNVASPPAPQERTSGDFPLATLKPHTPGSRMQVRGSRYYEPQNGRWLSRDTVEESSLHAYQFCGANAVDRWDLLGYLFGLGVSVRIEGEFWLDMGNFDPEILKNTIGSMVRIWWRPPAKDAESFCCDEVSFVQIAQTRHERKVYWDVFLPWHIDADPGTIFYPHQEPWSKGIAFGSMKDDPGAPWLGLLSLKQEFETCAVCTKGDAKKSVYGCVTWTHEVLRANTSGGEKWYMRRTAEHGADSKDTGFCEIPYKAPESSPTPVLKTHVHLNWGMGLQPSSTWISLLAGHLGQMP